MTLSNKSCRLLEIRPPILIFTPFCWAIFTPFCWVIFTPFCWVIFTRLLLVHFYPILLGHLPSFVGSFYSILLGHFIPFCWVHLLELEVIKSSHFLVISRNLRFVIWNSWKTVCLLQGLEWMTLVKNWRKQQEMKEELWVIK